VDVLLTSLRSFQNGAIREQQHEALKTLLGGLERIGAFPLFRDERDLLWYSTGGKRRPGDGRSLQAAHQELHYLLELSLSVAEVGRDHGYREPRGASRRGGPRLDGCLAAPQPARRV
jgi:hypothetical protein